MNNDCVYIVPLANTLLSPTLRDRSTCALHTDCDSPKRLTGSPATCHRHDVGRATRLQMLVRGVAAITAVLFVAGGVLAMRHEADRPHVRDRAGGYAHAKTLSGQHDSRSSDIHGQHDPDSDAGDCTLLTLFHQGASAVVSGSAPAAHASAVRRADSPGIGRHAVVTAVYRLAPKTSPPLAA